MSSRRIWGRISTRTFASLGACVLLAVACSSSEEAAPTRTTTPAPVGNDGGSAAPDADPSCTTDAGCFTCEPSTLTDFYNACTEGQCAPFDNKARLPLYGPGKPLPPVP